MRINLFWLKPKTFSVFTSNEDIYECEGSFIHTLKNENCNLKYPYGEGAKTASPTRLPNRILHICVTECPHSASDPQQKLFQD